ncbi:MAG: ABC transporter substrate-binding protein [Burkholderiaceae bacterium]
MSLAHADTPAPDAFVNKISTEVLDKIRQDKDVQSGNPAKISEFVDTTIMPVVDFERMTALAVGRSWRQATPEQKKRLMAEFRTLLVRTYSGALASVGDQQIRMKPFRGKADDTDVVVRSEVVAKQGEPIQLDYRLEKAGDTWKIFDLNVMGVWLIDNYRNQFSQEINAKGIDGLIDSLAEKNKQFAGNAGKS